MAAEFVAEGCCWTNHVYGETGRLRRCGRGCRKRNRKKTCMQTASQAGLRRDGVLNGMLQSYLHRRDLNIAFSINLGDSLGEMAIYGSAVPELFVIRRHWSQPKREKSLHHNRLYTEQTNHVATALPRVHLSSVLC